MHLPSLKQVLRFIRYRLPGFDYLAHQAQRFTPSGRTVIAREAESLKRWREQCHRLFARPLNPAAGKTVLMIGQTRVDFVALESFVLKAFEAAGYRPVVLSGPGWPVHQAYKAEGIVDRYFYQEFSPLPRMKEARQLAAGIKTFPDLIEATYRGIRIGKYVASTLMRMWRQGSIPVAESKVAEELVDRLAQSMAFVDGAHEMIRRFQPGAAVFVDRGYSPSGELFDTCIDNNIPCYSWNAAHRNNALMMKRFDRSNATVHPSSLSRESWKTLRELPWSDELTGQVRRELSWCYSSGEWYSEVGTQVNKQELEKESLIRQLSLDPNKKTGVIFSHIFWDATFFWGIDLFRDYEDWFVQTVKAACKNDRMNWLVKVHPANVVKDHRDGVTGDPSEIQALRKHIGELPPHVRIIPADWKVSTFSLFNIMDYCLTVRGTVGIEAAMLGKTVLTAGTGRYDRYGFTHDFDQQTAYLDALDRLETIPAPTPAETELAVRYGYGVFLGRPLPLSSLEMEYQKDAGATLKVGWKLRTFEELQQAPDLQEASRFIQSGSEDYLAPFRG